MLLDQFSLRTELPRRKLVLALHPSVQHLSDACSVQAGHVFSLARAQADHCCDSGPTRAILLSSHPRMQVPCPHSANFYLTNWRLLVCPCNHFWCFKLGPKYRPPRFRGIIQTVQRQCSSREMDTTSSNGSVNPVCLREGRG